MADGDLSGRSDGLCQPLAMDAQGLMACFSGRSLANKIDLSLKGFPA
jgi:hypothetical protein